MTVDGWTTELLENASKSAGLDQNYWRIIFPNGVVDVIDYFNDQCNLELSELRLNEPRVSEKIRAAVKYRLEMNNKYKEQIRSCMAVYGLHPIRASKACYRTVDAIWRVAGDTSTDWNFYSKRALLAGVYLSTLMHWLTDKSENNAETWEFLNRRLGEVGKFNKGMGSFKSKLKSVLPNFSS